MIFHLTSSGATHTLHFLFPPHAFPSFLLFPSPCSDKCTDTYAETHPGLNQPSAADLLITLHSHKANDFPTSDLSGPRGAAVTCSPYAIFQHQKADEEKMIYQCHCALSPRLIHKHNARWQKRGNSSSTCGVMLQHSMDLSTCIQSAKMIQIKEINKTL